MKTVKELSETANVSVRTLHYYDEKGLLKPSCVTPSGYRLYDGEAEKKLMTILLFRELRFSLSEIKRILNDPGFDRESALKDQIQLLKLERERLDGVIESACNLLMNGDIKMGFKSLDRSKLESYKAEAKERWGNTAEYAASQAKEEARTEAENDSVNSGLMDIFRQFGEIKGGNPSSPEAKALAKKLMDYISANYYKCTPEILSGLGEMYVADERFRENIDSAGGSGTAEFANKAIKSFVLG